MPEQPLSVVRRPLDVEDYVDILRRHRSWILGPAFLGLVLGVVTAYLWPDSYLATGRIRVVPPKVPSRLVQSNVTEEMTSRINTIYQDIIARDSLLNLITTYNLYPDDRKRLPTDDVIEQMRLDIQLGPLQSNARGVGGSRESVNAFSVNFSYSDRKLAQKVCSDLIARFQDGSIKQRADSSQLTTMFFKDQYEVAKRDLDEVDAKLAAFKARNLGGMPDQEQMILGRITAMEASIQATNGQISRSQQDRLQMETQLRDLRDQAQALSQPVMETASAPQAKSEKQLEVERELERAQTTLTAMKESYTDSHPDIQRLTSFIQSKRAQREELVRESEAARTEGGGRTRAVANPANQVKAREVASSILRLQAALQAKDMEMDDLNRQLTDTKSKLRSAQARMEATPGASQEYLQLMRERDVAATRHEEIGRKMQDSAMATDLVSRGQAEMLELLEPPAIPERPYAPKRELIIGIGLVVGLGLGLSLAGGREVKDTSLKNLKDVRAYTRLTVLGSIPLLENDFVIRRRRRLGWLAWTASLLLGVLLMVGSVVYYYTAKS